VEGGEKTTSDAPPMYLRDLTSTGATGTSSGRRGEKKGAASFMGGKKRTWSAWRAGSPVSPCVGKERGAGTSKKSSDGRGRYEGKKKEMTNRSVPSLNKVGGDGWT